jgi:hypothetical protein
MPVDWRDIKAEPKSAPDSNKILHAVFQQNGNNLAWLRAMFLKNMSEFDGGIVEHFPAQGFAVGVGNGDGIGAREGMIIDMGQGKSPVIFRGL